MKKESTRLKRNYLIHDGYFIDFENEENTGGRFYSLYDEADRLEEQRIYDGNSKFLESIAEEINLRGRIIKNELFKLGELLILGKKLCQKEKKGFKDWIASNFDFSYETAVNLMNVFKNCMGWKNLVDNVPLSILYKIAAPSFSDELRDFLFTKGNLSKMTNNKFTRIIKKYKEGGMDAIEDDVEQFRKAFTVFRQINYSYDQYKNGLVHLVELQEKIEKRGKGRAYLDCHSQLEYYEDKAHEINTIIYTTLENVTSQMEEGMKEAHSIFEKYFKSVEEMM